MARRLIGRLGTGLLAVLGVVVITFLLQFVVPGDPARNLAPRTPTPEALAVIRERLRLDDPILVQFGHYLWRLLHGDLGESYVRREAVTTLIAERLPATAVLALAGVLAEVLLGTLLGIVASLRRGAARVITPLNLVLLTVPPFTLGLFLLLAFGYGLGLLPVTQGMDLTHLVLPALTLGLAGAPWYANIVRDHMRDALSSAYVRTAVAKGLSDRRIIGVHVVRNVFSPVLTMMGMDFGSYLSGVVVVEAVFGWPGIGQLAVQSLDQLDRPVVMGTVLVGAVAVVAVNILADVVRWYVDPRTRDEPA